MLWRRELVTQWEQYTNITAEFPYNRQFCNVLGTGRRPMLLAQESRVSLGWEDHSVRQHWMSECEFLWGLKFSFLFLGK